MLGLKYVLELPCNMIAEASLGLDLRPNIPFSLRGPILGPRPEAGIASTFNTGGVVLNSRDSLLMARENDHLALPGQPDTTLRMGIFIDNGQGTRRIGGIDWTETLDRLSAATGKHLVSAEDARFGLPNKAGLVWVSLTGVEKKGPDFDPWTICVPFDLKAKNIIPTGSFLLNHYVKDSKNGINHSEFGEPIQTIQVREQGNDHTLTTIKSPSAALDQPVEISRVEYPKQWWNIKGFGTTGNRFPLDNQGKKFLQIYHGREKPTSKDVGFQYTLGAGISEFDERGYERVKLGYKALATFDRVSEIIRATGREPLSSDPKKAVLYMQFARLRGELIEGLVTVGDREIWRIYWRKKDVINSVEELALAA